MQSYWFYQIIFNKMYEFSRDWRDPPIQIDLYTHLSVAVDPQQSKYTLFCMRHSIEMH